MDIDSSDPLEPLIPKPWKLSDLKNVVEKWQTFKREEGFWNTFVRIQKENRKLIDNHTRAVAGSLSRTTTNHELCRASAIQVDGGHIPPNFLLYWWSPKRELCLSTRVKSLV